MHCKLLRHTGFTTLLLLAALALSACGGAFGPLAPPYPGPPGNVPTDMQPVDAEDVDMALPPGWATKPLAPGSPDVLKLAFVKEGTSINGQLLCNNAFLTRKDAGITMQTTVRAVSGNAKVVRGPFALGDSVMAPVIEGYEGTVTAEGQELDMSFWIAHNVSDLGCQYGLFVVGSREDMAGVEPEIVAIVRSLR